MRAQDGFGSPPAQTEPPASETPASISARDYLVQLLADEDRRAVPAIWGAWAAEWLDAHGELVVALIDAAQAFERIPDKWSDGDERGWLWSSITHFTTPERDSAEAT